MGIERPNVEQFLVDEIDSVPHLEALLLLWRNAPRQCSARQLADQLYVPHARASSIAEDLYRRGLIAREARHDGAYFYDTRSEERNLLMEAVDEMHRRELIRVSGIIHSKASPGIRAFADAFRLRKDKH
jgi:DNA-binding MarR family transcriptional regulator